MAPQYVAEDLLRGEGFTDVQYVPTGQKGFYQALGSGEADIAGDFAAPLIIQLDKGMPIVVLGGVHVGCFELFGTERVRDDPRPEGEDGRRARAGYAAAHLFLPAWRPMSAWIPQGHHLGHASVGRVDAAPRRGKIDAFMGFPPEPQELRAKRSATWWSTVPSTGPGLSTSAAWSSATGTSSRKYPVATKRALRAILKAADICALSRSGPPRPWWTRGVRSATTTRSRRMKDIPYAPVAGYDPEDTMRFYALRLHEIGMIKSSPQKIIAQGTDWRFLRSSKEGELKG